MIVIGPSARRSAVAIGSGSPSCVAIGSKPLPTSPRRRRWPAECPWAATAPPGRRFGPPRPPPATPDDVLAASTPGGSTPTPRRTGPRASSAPLRPLVSWKRRGRRAWSAAGRSAPGPAPGWRTPPQPGHSVQAATARRRGHHAEPGTAAAVSVGHRGGGELVLGQHRGDVRRGRTRRRRGPRCWRRRHRRCSRRRSPRDIRRCGRRLDAAGHILTCFPSPHTVTRLATELGSPVRPESQIFRAAPARNRPKPVAPQRFRPSVTGCWRSAARWRRTVRAMSRSGAAAIAAHHHHAQRLRRGVAPAPVAVGASHVDAGAPAVTGQRDGGVDRRLGHLGHLQPWRGLPRRSAGRRSPDGSRSPARRPAARRPPQPQPTSTTANGVAATGPCRDSTPAPRAAAAGCRAGSRRARGRPRGPAWPASAGLRSARRPQRGTAGTFRRCASNSRRSALDSDPRTYAASQVR